MAAPLQEPTRPAPVGCEPYRSLVAQYNWNVQIAMAIMEAESTYDVNQNGRFEPEEHCYKDAVGDRQPINGLLAPSCGLFQIRTLKGRPSCEALKDPATNIEWAYKVSSGGSNWKPWSVFTNKKYLKFL